MVDELKAAGMVGDTILAVKVLWPRSIAAPAPHAFCRQIVGRRVLGISRRAKYLVLSLSANRYLLIHLRMSGRLILEPMRRSNRPPIESPHVRVVFQMHDSGRLCFRDPRKFGRIHLLADPTTLLGRLGPEPLDPCFTAADLALRLAPRHRALKPLLLDQTFIAGLGNIYVDEALWEARLHPLQPASSLATREVQALLRAIRRVLRRGLARGGTRLGTGQGNFQSLLPRYENDTAALKVFRRSGNPCPRCGHPVLRSTVGQRGTHTCPRCQVLHQAHSKNRSVAGERQ